MARKIKSDIINVVEEPIMKDTSANILGTEYQIVYEGYNEDPDFKDRNAAGLCDMMIKKIKICKVETYPEYKELPKEHLINAYKEITRHEIMHAFFYESGLDNESHGLTNGWSVDEEIVDWFAIQSPKIFKVFKELDLI